MCPESEPSSDFASNSLLRILCLGAMPEPLVGVEAICQMAGFETVGTTDCYRALHLLKTQRVDLFTQNICSPGDGRNEALLSAQIRLQVPTHKGSVHLRVSSQPICKGNLLCGRLPLRS